MPTSSQMQTFNFQHFLCNECLSFYRNAINYILAFPKNVGNSLHKKCQTVHLSWTYMYLSALNAYKYFSLWKNVICTYLHLLPYPNRKSIFYDNQYLLQLNTYEYKYCENFDMFSWQVRMIQPRFQEYGGRKDPLMLWKWVVVQNAVALTCRGSFFFVKVCLFSSRDLELLTLLHSLVQ